MTPPPRRAAAASSPPPPPLRTRQRTGAGGGRGCWACRRSSSTVAPRALDTPRCGIPAARCHPSSRPHRCSATPHRADRCPGPIVPVPLRVVSDRAPAVVARRSGDRRTGAAMPSAPVRRGGSSPTPRCRRTARPQPERDAAAREAAESTR
jgi:hypothetical protein